MLYSLFKFPPNRPDLAEIDSVFRTSISKKPVREQIIYCRGIIATLLYQLRHLSTEETAPNFRRHLDAAQRELQVLFHS